MTLRERSVPKEQKKRFPLVLWQETEDYKEEYDVADRRLKEIKGQLLDRGFVFTSLCRLYFDGDGHPAAWLDSGPPRFLKIKNAEQALELAKKHGSGGYWTLDELSELVEKGGIIIKAAMKEMGFRPHKKIPGRWARMKRGEFYRLVRREEDVFVPIEGEKLHKLQELMVLPNTKHGMGKEFNLRVGEPGLIFIHLVADPFAGTTTETLWKFGAQLRQRGHLAREQYGFVLDARNVALGEKKAIHITATASGKNAVETVWPTSTNREGFFQLVEDLAGKLKSEPLV